MSQLKDDRRITHLFAEKQGDLFEKSIEESYQYQPVECLGQTFESEEARRNHYLALLAEKLKDPEFRKTPGFPKGTDEAILGMSDPPYYTACPNPFMEDFVRFHGRPYDPNEEYSRDPFAVDVSVGKTDQLYKAHSYHTKVPHLAIVPSILHYTKPGDIVLDGFGGSGMTGVAAQFCGTAPGDYRLKLQAEWKQAGYEAPEWGARRTILGDLGPAASFIAANYNIPFDVDQFAKAAQRILDEVEDELGWMYETLHNDGKMKGRINYTVWSEVFSCPECSHEVVFLKAALDPVSKSVNKEFLCPGCGTIATKEQMNLVFETFYDDPRGKTERRPKRMPVLINYNVGKERYEKEPDQKDLEIINRISKMGVPIGFPIQDLPDCQMTRVGRIKSTNTLAIHHMYVSRAAISLESLWTKTNSYGTNIRRILLFWIEQAVRNMSLLNNYEPKAFSQNARGPKTFLYIASGHSEVSPWFFLEGKLNRLIKAFSPNPNVPSLAFVTTGDCSSSGLISKSIDYIFTDPPFGENIYYADLNFLIESWHQVTTETETEAIVDRVREKSTVEYQDLMKKCFEEYYRILKPGRWMTVVFSNSKNSIWRAIQEALGIAGFVVADVRTLDKKQGSFKQVTSSAVKQDLVISAYKPTEALSEQFKLGLTGSSSVWAFISEHLGNVPVFVSRAGTGDIVAERTPQMLHDRMIAFFVQHHVAVPISGPDFFTSLDENYPMRDGMYFLHTQVSEYDRKRTKVSELHQLDFFVSDEATATLWVRQNLMSKPQSFQELQPQFMQQLKSWAKHEKTIELKEILELNFLCYDGKGPVPDQIAGYLSRHYHNKYRGLERENPTLKAKAIDRWYVPDPKKEGDLEKLRLRTLLKEFEDYRNSTSRKIKQFRTEAVRAGFKHCYDQQDYQTIVDVAAKLPEEVIQEDEKLLMYYDVAAMRIDND